MITVKNLSKHYGGKRALGPVSFEIGDGETVGFLGLNGAGKTTALRILACDLRPSGGQINVGGVDAVSRPEHVRARIGFLPEHPPLYQDMTVRDYLRFAAALRGVRGAAFVTRLQRVLDLTDLGGVEGDVIGTLSHGYRQRVGVAQAIIHDPEFIILDEPTRGLDPVQIVEMRALLHGLKARHTVLLSSHILTEISQTCDQLLVLGGGQLLAAGTEAELAARREVSHRVRIGVTVPPERSRAEIEALLATVDGVTTVTFDADGPADVVLARVGASRDVRAALARAVIGAAFDLVELERDGGELEATFIDMVGPQGARETRGGVNSSGLPEEAGTEMAPVKDSHGRN